MSRARDFADLAGSADAGGITGKNLIINGAATVNQRGNVSASTSNTYTLDRWERITNGTTAASAVEQSTDVPSGQGFANSLKVDCTTADTTLGAFDYVIMRQKMEGQNLQHIKKGTSNAEAITLSFWVKSSVTGTHIVEAYDGDNNRQSSQSYTVNLANTWEYKTVTYPADTTGAFDNDNNGSLWIHFWLMAGADFQSGTLNTGWAGATNGDRVVGQVNTMSDTANNWYITGVQLEVGEQATPFEHRSYGDELARCQRYFQPVRQYAEYSIGTTGNIGTTPVAFTTPMRAAPTMTVTSAAGSSTSLNSWNTAGSASTGYYSHYLNFAVTTSGYMYIIREGTADAEL